MELHKQTNGNGHLPTKKSHPVIDGSFTSGHVSTFDPMKYMLKLPTHKKVILPNGQVRFEKAKADYLPLWLPREMRIKVPMLMLWGMKYFALTHRLARPTMDPVDEGNLIFFLDATHWVQHEAAEEVNHYLIDFLFDKKIKQVVK